MRARTGVSPLPLMSTIRTGPQPYRWMTSAVRCETRTYPGSPASWSLLARFTVSPQTS